LAGAGGGRCRAAAGKIGRGRRQRQRLFYCARNSRTASLFTGKTAIRAAAILNKNNLLRHAGATYALGQARDYCRRQGDRVAAAALNAAIVRANGYLRRFIASAPVGGVAGWSIPERLDELAPAGSPVAAKLGGAALGVLALLAADGDGNLPIARALGEYLLTQQRAGGSFVSKVIAGEDREDSFASLYYPGQAIMALTELYARDHGRRWLNAAIRGMKYLTVSRARSGIYPADPWTLSAG
jgi:hypothetical protein